MAVGFFGPATYGILPNILGDYRKRFPDVEYTVVYRLMTSGSVTAFKSSRAV
ncbi:MAG: hypothetical protein WA982_08270 [Rubrobacteraceae bacterium]